MHNLYFYSVSELYITKTFTTWIMFLYRHFKDLSARIFPDKHAFQHLKPKFFKYFKKFDAEVDCSQFFCKVPRNYPQRVDIYSAYKRRTAMKCLIAVNANGAECFISDLYEGSIDDVTLFSQFVIKFVS